MRDILLTPIIIIRIAPSRKNRKRAQRKEVFTGMSSEKKKIDRTRKICEAQSKHASEAAEDMIVARS